MVRGPWTIETLLFAIYFAFGLSWLSYSPLLPEIEKTFTLDHAHGALLISSVSLAKAFVPLLAGLLATRLGISRAIGLGAWLAALAVVAPWMPGFDSMLVARFLFGVGGAIVVTLMGAMVMPLFSTRQLPVVNGLNNVAVNVGVTSALYASVPCSESLGWRATLMAFGCISLVLALAWQFLLPNGGTVAVKRQPKVSLGQVLRRRETWLVALAFTGPLSLYLCLNTWLPTHYVETFHLTRASASSLTALMNLVGIPTAVLAGLLTSRLGLRRPLIIAAGLLMVPAACGLVLAPSNELRHLCAVMLGISFFLYTAPLFTIPMELPEISTGEVAMIQGVVYSLAYFSSSVAPVLVGRLRDVTGSYVPGLLLFAVLAGSLALAGLLLPETGPGRSSAER